MSCEMMLRPRQPRHPSGLVHASSLGLRMCVCVCVGGYQFSLDELQVYLPVRQGIYSFPLFSFVIVIVIVIVSMSMSMSMDMGKW